MNYEASHEDHDIPQGVYAIVALVALVIVPLVAFFVASWPKPVPSADQLFNASMERQRVTVQAAYRQCRDESLGPISSNDLYRCIRRKTKSSPTTKE